MLVGLVFGATQLDSDISAEETKLLALGVDVRPITPTNDAHGDYALIAQEIRFSKPGLDQAELIFLKLEAATVKPFANFIRTQQGNQPVDKLNRGVIEPIDSWCQDHGRIWAKKHDWKALERLYRFEDKFKLQLFAGGSSIFGMWLPDSGPPLGYLIQEDAEVRRWLRQKLMSYDFQGYVRAGISSFGRAERRFDGFGLGFVSMSTLDWPPTKKPIPKWEKQSKSDPEFRKKAELTLLVQIRKIAENKLKRNGKIAVKDRLVEPLSLCLQREGSYPALWAADHLNAFPDSHFVSTIFWNTQLIEIDLRDCRETGNPLIPTFSKPYCVDPDTGAPIVVDATRSGITMKSKWAHGSWSSWVGW